MRATGLIALLIPTFGCLPVVDGAEQVQVLAYEPEGYSPARVDLALTSLQPLETPDIRVFFGGSLAFMGGPRIIEAPAGFSAQAERGVDGSLVPTDYLTLLAFCLLHHLEESRRYIASLAVPGVVDAPPYEIYIHPEVSSTALGRFTDNMAYVRGPNWFLVAPEEELDALPLACNRAVVAHEFAHALTYHSDMTERFASGDVVAIDEGVADIVGAGVTRDAYGVRASTLLAERDLNIARVDEMGLAPHERGAVLASLFWAYRGALIGARVDIDDATDQVVALALALTVSLRGVQDPRLVDFVVRAIAEAQRSDLFCIRAPLAFPVPQVIDACAEL